MLRESLIQAGFQEGESLDQYIKLIESNYTTSQQKFKTQQHHIIPRCYFKRKKVAVDNTVENLVHLSHADHLLAHYYLCLCAPKTLYRDLVLAFNYMINKKNHYSVVSEVEISPELLQHFNWLKEEKARLNSKAFSGAGNPNYGAGTNHWTEESRQKQSRALKGRSHTAEHNLRIGRAQQGKVVSQESRQKMSASWEYTKHVTPEICHKRALSMLNKNTKGKIYCVELDRTFISAADAARYLQRTHGGNMIRACVKGQRELAYGYHWEEK